ncbi:hypothetical protein, partial [Sulfitobacter sp. CW3]|uniref:hypothetical protein n=1 Tax=Sulfitobacter sp. CW3 TaxID=2861965 RepID=UPI001C6013E9
VVREPWPTSAVAPSHTSSLENPKMGRTIEEIFRRLHGAESREREKLSGREKYVGEIPPRRGEIIAIVTVIKLEFIGIIIIISTTDSVISTTPL